ncbi:MAG TPA: dihydropteroate synthase [Verrucomicrobiae bacterium]|nr:dihydropteroate synthase [Verrucomicrobiae bacterium]
MLLRCREFEFRFPRPALVMGIVNVTPDSFSDGGRFLDPARAVEHALKLVADGAEMLDIGGESTRPGAAPVPELEELKRVMPVLKGLAGRVSVPISIDTMKAGVARVALDAGVSVINDVGANRRDPEMWRLAAESGAGYVCVHMQGTPQTMQHNPVYQNVVREVGEFFSDRLEQLSDCGIPREQIILDPGIGFGKTFAHNVQLIGGVRELVQLARPLLLGVSRKGFLGRLPGADAVGRLPGALACACLAVAAGARLIRAHDVAETVQAVRLTEAVMAEQR